MMPVMIYAAPTDRGEQEDNAPRESGPGYEM